MRKQIQLNKKRLTKVIQSARANEMTLREYLIILNRVKESVKLRKKGKKFGVEYDWQNAEFDKNLGWLMVPQVINSVNREQGFISIFMSSEELPTEQQSLYAHYFL